MLTFDSVEELYVWLRGNSPKTIILEGFEKALRGVISQRPGLACLVYDQRVVVEILRRDLQMDYGDATMYFDREIYSLWKKYKNPCFLQALGCADRIFPAEFSKD